MLLQSKLHLQSDDSYLTDKCFVNLIINLFTFLKFGYTICYFIKNADGVVILILKHI